METRKIASACFIGGAICCAVALMVAPALWWLGMIAGFAGGYISYEFREVLRAIPVALRAAMKGGSWAWGSLVEVVEDYIKKPHPFAYPAAIIVAPFWVFLMSEMIYSFVYPTVPVPALIEFLMFVFLTPIMLVAFFVGMVIIVAFPMVALAFIGARVGERSFWEPIMGGNHTMSQEQLSQALEAKGLERKPLSYRNVYRWITKGIGITALFFVWTLWKYLAIGMWNTFRFFGRFAWHLFKLIHSQKRVLCGIDGALGGAVAYIWLQSTSCAVGEQMVLVVFGGLLGATFGVVNWEVVSKRLLHVGTKS